MYRTHFEIAKTVFGKKILTLHARKALHFNGGWFVPFRYFVFSPGVMARRKDEKRHAKRRNNEKRLAEKRNNASRKDEITRSATQKDEKRV